MTTSAVPVTVVGPDGTGALSDIVAGRGWPLVDLCAHHLGHALLLGIQPHRRARRRHDHRPRGSDAHSRTGVALIRVADPP